MKTNNLFLYGGIAVVAYLIFKPKTVAPGVTQVAPVTGMLPAPVPNTGASILTALSALVPVATKLLSPSSVPAAPAAPAALPAGILNTPVFTPVAPVSSYTDDSTYSSPPLDLTDTVTPADDFTSLELMEQGGMVSGLANIQAAKLGLY